MSIIDNVLGRLGVRCHDNRSLPFTDAKLGTYTVCLSCGQRFAYKWPELVKDHPYLREEVHA